MFVTMRIDLEGIILSKIREKKDKFCMVSLTCGIYRSRVVVRGRG